MGVLSGKAALVTGGGRGIGRGVTVALAEAGADVLVNYFSDETAAEETAQSARKHGVKAIAVQADVSDQSSVELLVERCVGEFGKLDIAVSNAVYSDREPFWQIDMAGFRRTIDVAMWGAYYLLRSATKHMLASKTHGNIVFISSPHAYVPVPRAMPYNMAKAAIDQMARTAAIELAEHRIRVNTIHPGWIDTPGERKFASEETLQAAGEKLPWGRLGRPDEIGRGVVFMCDDASEYITGSSLLIDGGVTLPWWANRGSAVPE